MHGARAHREVGRSDRRDPLPEGSFRADAGTDVVVDILFFRKRKIGEPEGDQSWLDTRRGPPGDRRRGRDPRQPLVRAAPDFVLGTHALTSVPSARPTPACRAPARISTRRCRRHLSSGSLYDGEPTIIDRSGGSAPTRR
jgi:hypothetical protein